MGMPSSGFFTPRASVGVGGAGGGEAALEIAHADRIDLGVVPLDAADRVLRQFDRGDLFCRQRRRQFDGGLEAPLRFGQGVLPVCF